MVLNFAWHESNLSWGSLNISKLNIIKEQSIFDPAVFKQLQNLKKFKTLGS